MRRGIGTLLVFQVVAITVVLAAPSAAFAEPAPIRLDERSVPAAATRARRPFDGEALRRAVETALRSPASPDKQAPPVAAGRDSLWNGVLIGAGIGAVAGGLSAAATTVGSTDQATGPPARCSPAQPSVLACSSAVCWARESARSWTG